MAHEDYLGKLWELASESSKAFQDNLASKRTVELAYDFLKDPRTQWITKQNPPNDFSILFDELIRLVDKNNPSSYNVKRLPEGVKKDCLDIIIEFSGGEEGRPFVILDHENEYIPTPLDFYWYLYRNINLSSTELGNPETESGLGLSKLLLNYEKKDFSTDNSSKNHLENNDTAIEIELEKICDEIGVNYGSFDYALIPWKKGEFKVAFDEDRRRKEDPGEFVTELRNVLKKFKEKKFPVPEGRWPQLIEGPDGRPLRDRDGKIWIEFSGNESQNRGRGRPRKRK